MLGFKGRCSPCLILPCRAEVEVGGALPPARCPSGADIPALGAPASLRGAGAGWHCPPARAFRGGEGSPFPRGWGDTEVTARPLSPPLGAPKQAGGCGAGTQPLGGWHPGVRVRREGSGERLNSPRIPAAESGL